MTTPVSNIVNKTLYPLLDMRVLCFLFDGRFEDTLVQTPHKFYGCSESYLNDSYQCEKVAPLPSNISNIDPSLIFDCIIYNHIEAQEDKAKTISHILHVPRLLVQHFSPLNDWNSKIPLAKNTVFVHDIIRKQFNHDGDVIPYGVKVPAYNADERPIDVLIHGQFELADFQLVKFMQKMNFKVEVYGNNKGLSEEIPDDELATKFSASKIFLNLSGIGNIPLSAIHAMAHGCCIVSNETPMTTQLFSPFGTTVKNINDFAPTINKLLSGGWIEQGLWGREVADKYHNMELVVPAWDHKITQLGREVYIR